MGALLPLAWVNSSLLSYGSTRMAKVLLPLAWVTSSVPLHGCTSYDASIIASGLAQFIFVTIWLYAVWLDYYCLWPGLPHFAIVWLYVVWRMYYCLWPGLTHLCYRMAVPRMTRVLLPLVYGSPHVCHRIAVRRYYCHWPGLIELCYHMAGRCMARVFCLWPGLPHLWHCMAVCRMSRL